ncbi:MAG: DUF427 domain-containing protein [Leptospiraceae bacterium]|jgi:uncharacterized protein (DUF427 family)|nr:DUF427 domain-containing protein [Leptospiraceae bacterium]MCZ8347171.1 DUF427 domain-containing protein [Leptospiraceae bacterium]PJE00597.1 MAG: hypothetical protein CK427_13415 [Leptospira sp.]
MKAIWNGEIIAESEDTIVVDGAHYFPVNEVKMHLLKSSTHNTTCPYKGKASYYDVEVDGQTNKNSAWYYPTIKSESIKEIAGRIAFWNGVKVEK